MEQTFASLEIRAAELGGKSVSGGISWHWYEGFPTRESAKDFLTHPAVYDHCGVYEDKDGTFSVRIRQSNDQPLGPWFTPWVAG